MVNGGRRWDRKNVHVDIWVEKQMRGEGDEAKE